MPTQASNPAKNDDTDDWVPVESDNLLSIEKFCDEEVISNIDENELGKIICGVYHQL